MKKMGFSVEISAEINDVSALVPQAIAACLFYRTLCVYFFSFCSRIFTLNCSCFVLIVDIVRSYEHVVSSIFLLFWKIAQKFECDTVFGIPEPTNKTF